MSDSESSAESSSNADSWRARLVAIQEAENAMFPDDYTIDRTGEDYPAVGLPSGVENFEVTLDPGERRPVLDQLREDDWQFVPKRDERYSDGWTDKKWIVLPPDSDEEIQLESRFRFGSYPPAPDYRHTTAPSVVREKEHEEQVKDEFRLSGRQMLVLRYCANYDGPYKLVPMDAPPSAPVEGTQFRLIAEVPPSEEQKAKDILTTEAMKVPGIVVADWDSTPKHTTPNDRHKVWVRLRYLPEEDNYYRENDVSVDVPLVDESVPSPS